MKFSEHSSIVALISCALLNGCAHIPTELTHSAPQPVNYDARFKSVDEGVIDVPPPNKWWRLFDDEQLDSFISLALKHNTDLREAIANLERTRSIESEVHEYQKPTLSLNGGPGFGHASGLSLLQRDTEPTSRGTYSAGFSLSYQVDLFGRLRHAVESATADSEASQAAVDLVRVNVAANTAHAYATACSSGLRLRLAMNSITLQEDAVRFSVQLRDAGKASNLDVERAQIQLKQLQASLPPLQASRQNSLFRLATLTGVSPNRFQGSIDICESPPKLKGLLPTGDGADLLRRRPDIRQAERRVASATARVSIAIADLYPKVVFGVSGSSIGFLEKFGNRETLSYSMGPLVSWTFPNKVAARSHITQAEASLQAAIAHLDGRVLTALREVESSLQIYTSDLKRHKDLQSLVEIHATMAMQAQSQFLSGKIGKYDVLDARRALATSEIALASSTAQIVEDQIAVFMALGGGWDTEEVVMSSIRKNDSNASQPHQ